ncbi:hypothetical protein BCV70DRAFT_87331 [Testicularia cyperi]|uniref:Uncharacterized protein n=1 Tax=Testicularia cyperi TaxID=1882483 RepID=A0A317XUE1_9BASI|nr:hypothetical protein BCV70DRAFT_87331 [Testicularia cyperi]
MDLVWEGFSLFLPFDLVVLWSWLPPLRVACSCFTDFVYLVPLLFLPFPSSSCNLALTAGRICCFAVFLTLLDSCSFHTTDLLPFGPVMAGHSTSPPLLILCLPLHLSRSTVFLVHVILVRLLRVPCPEK